MLLNNLLLPKLPLFFYNLQFVFYFFDGGERDSVELSLLHTNECKLQVTCRCHFVTFHLLWPPFQWSISCLNIFNSPGLWKVTPNCCVIIWDAPTTNDFGSYFENCSWIVPSLYHSRYVSVVVTEVWKLSEFGFISKLAPTNNSNKKWDGDKIYAVVQKGRGSSKKFIIILWNRYYFHLN